ncbi:3-demethylubiquinone-9 3-methyltransferase [Tritonibacter multivorans]|uniref:3-demethylubiquinone-9 3-methyltransferase n=1 Tax=Tritonibacter multivorans TaxID=928856 RepID=A0A0P1GIU9_9RHOB|nr:class I SAM-dependent methyltransferase [Tritonibacter multivorans]MDA7420317.1 methyltransferase domain-containing protein [Tritonibacter multivorans]CUH81830.1 3-demethylubiquinone-9 3-methyltransferase [Tritonibacter multivorans]SFC44663.1 Ubiquinone/menaquinone biosynthesis C-methylase UbiE [Tritonibacter multivorans]
MTKDYVTINRDLWNAEAADWAEIGARLWASPEPVWGNWNNADDGLGLLPEDMSDLDAIELGCGTGYVSGWMAKRGARVTGIDVSAEQLKSARRFAQEHGADVQFLEANAEDTALPDQSFDFAISEYGAAIWCRPSLWLAEAFRLLRPGGRLVFLGNHPLSLICSPPSGAPCDDTLHRPYRGMWGADWTEVEFEPSGICFNLTMADWMALFLQIGFTVERYQELYAPDWAEGVRAAIPADWAKSYPMEQVWHLQKPL